MHYYSADQVPVISQLAQAYAVCDRWFASAPCQTWPNRFFLHTGTANGYQNNSPVHFPYMMDTIFNRLSDHNQEWGIFYHDFPQSLTLSKLWTHLDRFRFFSEFKELANQGQLPAYSFIEPRFFTNPENLPNDQHPPHHVGLGEDLIADVYNTVRQSPNWPNTLLIIIYDEHGGCYDHVSPPASVPPDEKEHQPFNFNRYGVRIPAVLISPYIKPGTILRPDESTATRKAYPYDHTSVIATLSKCFNLGAPLSERDAVAPDLEKVLNLDQPDNNSLGAITPRLYSIPTGKIEEALAAPLNDFQKAIQDAAGHLPQIGDVGKTIQEQIDDHIKYLKQELGAQGGKLNDITEHANPKDALPYIFEKLQGFLGKGHA
jgi:phospholipase C